MEKTGPIVKIEMAYKKGSARLTSYLKADQALTWPEVMRAANWQANMVGVTGGPQAMSQEVRPVLAHKLYYRGATQTITEMP